MTRLPLGKLFIANFINVINVCTADVLCERRNRKITCEDFASSTAYCCDDPRGDVCCYHKPFYYYWYFWGAAFVTILIVCSVAITCCKAYNAHKRRINTNPNEFLNLNGTGVGNTAPLNRRGELPTASTAFVRDVPPSYDQVRKDGIDKQFEAFAGYDPFNTPLYEPAPPYPSTPALTDARPNPAAAAPNCIVNVPDRGESHS